MSFARLFLQKPLIAFLDEATSALDESNERLPTSVSVASALPTWSIKSRNTLEEFHDLLLTLHSNGRVELHDCAPTSVSG